MISVHIPGSQRAGLPPGSLGLECGSLGPNSFKLGHFPERTQHTRSVPGSFSETSSPEGQGDPKEASWTLCRDSVQDALGQRRVLSPEKSKDPS